MLDIDSSKFYYHNCKSVKIKDGSLRIMRYLPPKEDSKELATLSRRYYSESYELNINLPPEAVIDVVIIVSHTSPNSWRISWCNTVEAGLESMRTLTEVKGFISSLVHVTV